MIAITLVQLALLAAQAAALPNPGERLNYVVGPEDVLTVTVLNEDGLSGKFRVEKDGEFSYPFLGRVRAAGLTVAEVGDLIKLRLADGYLRRPQVTVDVDQFRSQNVFVMGEVRTPGKYVLSGPVTLLDALARAGAPTDAAGSEVLILHPKDPVAAVAGAPTLPDQRDAEVVTVNLREIQDGRLSRNVTIRDGDTIFVPKAKRFFVVGLVRNAGSYVLERNMTVLQAISTAGGIAERGSTRRLRIVRMVGSKRREFDAKPTDLVQPGDTIVVRQRLL
jgi:polysaccharide export outer membrane protein